MRSEIWTLQAQDALVVAYGEAVDGTLHDVAKLDRTVLQRLTYLL